MRDLGDGDGGLPILVRLRSHRWLDWETFKRSAAGSCCHFIPSAAGPARPYRHSAQRLHTPKKCFYGRSSATDGREVKIQ